MAEYGPWNSGITQAFIRPLVDNLTAVLQASEEAIYLEVFGVAEMPEAAAYQVWRRSRWVNPKFPAISIIPRNTRTEKGEGGPIISEAHKLEILIEDVGANPDTLADSVMRRVQGAHVTIERAPLSELFDGYLADRSHKPTWDIDHDYADFFNAAKSTYKQNGSLIITFTGLMEKT
jgi:hypothetical protein